MASNHLVLCHPLLLLPSIFPSISAFSNESVIHIRWPKYWSFSFSICPYNESSGLISFKIDWFDLLAVQGTLKSLLKTAPQFGDLLQKDLCQHMSPPRTIAIGAPDPIASHNQPMPLPETHKHTQASLAQSLVGSLLLSPGSWCTHCFVCSLPGSVSPVLWKFYIQIPLIYKVRFPGDT